MRSIFTLLLCLLGAMLAPTALLAQSSVATPVAKNSFDLAPGEKVTDSAGRTVENTGTTGNIKIKYDGTKSGTGQNIEVANIVLVTNQGSGGSKGVTVGTNNQATNIVLDKDGAAGRGNQVTVNVNGGNATITLNGDHNTITVGGTGNTVTINGDSNTGSGANASSGGTVTYGQGSNGNTWSSNGGNWSVGN